MGGNGRLGYEAEGPQPTPRPLESLAGRRIMQVACGNFHSVAIDEDGRVWYWGRLFEGHMQPVWSYSQTYVFRLRNRPVVGAGQGNQYSSYSLLLATVLYALKPT
mmetsp:Transcript_30390/g.49123  ORF Transcript_30390/g.49123 Transcript_30390/m.49123 type:complete len:105 (+) Transcript_30390:539-853(+)